VRAMCAGAEDYLAKPIDFDALQLAIERAIERSNLRVETENLRRQLRERDGEGLQGLVGTSPAMQKVYRVARQVAAAKATVLIMGESGTRKGELAKAVHQLGPRAKSAFVSLQCAALAESLLESEIFGHERGAFTGAIGAGSGASSKPREAHYRLNVVHIEMPPLRVRGADVWFSPITFSVVSRKKVTRASRHSPIARGARSLGTVGRATSASWRTSSSVRSCCARGRPSTKEIFRRTSRRSPRAMSGFQGRRWPK